MNIVYNDKTDLLYIRLDDRKQDVINRRITEDIVLDIGEGDRICWYRDSRRFKTCAIRETVACKV